MKTPRGPLLGMGALVVLTLVLVTAARLGGYRPTTEYAAAVSTRSLRFADQADGGITVTDGSTGAVLGIVDPGTNGFLRATVRGLATERKHQGTGAELPFVLSGRADGTILLQDPATGRALDLNAFGPTNSGAFARFLPPSAPRATTAAL